MRTSIHRRLWGGAVALLAAAGLTLGAGVAATAAPIIDQTTGTLHVLKHETPGGAAGDGTALTPAPGTPTIDGVVFTITQLDYDLNTNAGWTDLAALEGDVDAALVLGGGYTSSVETGAAGTAGEALFENIPVGAYLVKETDTPPGVTAAAPFIVTVPITNPDSTDEWLYDVYVYPKNAVTEAPEKTVSDASAAGLGDPVVYTITSEIPDLNTGQSIDLYAVRDTLAPQLTLTGVTVAFVGTQTGAPLDTADYVVTPTPPAAGADVIVKFTASGLGKLTANQDLQVATTITTFVNEVSATGIIANAPALYPNGPSWGPDITTPAPDPASPGVPGTPVETRWGNISLTKVSAGTDDGLPGASFQVYTSREAAIEGDPNEAVAADDDGDPATPPVTTFTTGTDGLLTISGLRYSEFADGEAIVAPGEPQTYWLREITAPDEHELLAEPYGPITVDGVPVDGELEIENAPANGGFELPFTGATGQWMYPAAGALLLAGAGLVLVARNRRKVQH
ncbi:SpaH/EbpB family LPXTG-anchored major pilin [Serinibacter salmoneus]|uniref:LPXTG-motif cell wall-anchored protein/fimbrial isopeptide formation D2 family protein n=1 Tax=Serinibacter salmoneus TaxID=556530 RepID=A0A2A9CX55_9MICO|nr:SpaH/EbpB family LPXTG-anchored major pilin [Serinibacter salmoneus]PFG18721.1 LPXTG-motif cell wall-anchored protein/fimbrial isopeptide formation D2 family protein [Serinibacter salmoneus]